MALDAAESSVDEDIYNIYKASQPKEFSDNCSDTLRPRTATDLLCDHRGAEGLDVLHEGP